MDPVVFMLAAFIIFGTLGNVITLYFFIKKPTTVPHIFISTLASVDLITCVITIPINIWAEYSDFQTDSILLCRLYAFMTTSTIPFASILMVPIAIDRFLSLFKPYSGGMKKKGAVIIIIAIALCSALFGTIFTMERMIWTTHVPNSTSVLNVSEALNVSYRNNSSWKAEPYCRHGYTAVVSRDFIEGFDIFYLCVFPVSVFITLVLYIIIYAYIVLMRRKHKHLFERKQETPAECTLELTNPDQESDVRGNDGVNNKSFIETFLSNIKLGIILFTTSIVFIVAYLPAFLMIRSLIPYNSFIFYMYFSYNVLHPITYAVFDESIRRQLFSCRCCRYICSRGSEQLRSMPTDTVVESLTWYNDETFTRWLIFDVYLIYYLVTGISGNVLGISGVFLK